MTPIGTTQEQVASYLRELSRIRAEPEATPELSLREPLLSLVRAFAQDAGRSNLLIAPEASAGEVGQPDIFVKDGPRLVGFIETKAPGADLSRLLRSDPQIKRYRQSLPNWVLTDYFRFVFIREADVVARIELADPELAQPVAGAPGPLVDALASFLAYAPPVIRSPRRLAQELARRARLLRDGFELRLRAEGPGGPLRDVLAFYQQTLMNDLDEAGFADTFAQTITYGMFLARLRHSTGPFTRPAVAQSIPPSVPFLRSAVRLLTDEDLLPRPMLTLLDDLAALLDNTQIDRIRREVAAGGLEHDLVIYFYERFLEQYDAGERINRGVYYTAPELVRYLIRATETLLERDFNLERGLADESVLVLDPAVGTGTFLLGAAEQALETEAPRGSASQRRLIREHILNHFYGFEILPAPYAVAHLKLSSFFEHHGYTLGATERVQVYLTNSLELGDAPESQLSLLPVVRGIVEEARSAGQIKREVPVLVIVGNPPYDRTTHNANPHSDALLEDFYRLNGVRLPERNTGPLQDDYLRFLRWAVWKLLEQDGAPGHGILAFVTNRGYIERKLHRAVRHFLLRQFDEIFVFDLHGDQREWFHDRVDEKVFPDVQAGIALSVFVKRPGDRDELATVHYRETFGTRAAKRLQAQEAALEDDDWQTLTPHDPLWLFVPYDVPPEYDRWPSVAQLFPKNVIGVQTHRDQLAVGFSEQELSERFTQFADPTVPDAHWEDQRIRSTAEWNLSDTRESIAAESPRNVIRWTYRPFDRRWVAFDDRLIDRTRTQISPHLLARNDNLALAFSYGSLEDGPYALVARSPVPAAVLSWRTFGQAYFAPLWLEGEGLLAGWDANLPHDLLARLAAAHINTNAEGFLSYVYGVLNAPSYRRLYAHGLRYDFARVPIARDPAVFERLRQLGADLVALHLLESPEIDGSAPRMDGNDEALLEQPRFDEREQAVYFAPDLLAVPVTASAWAYQQGSYPVLKDYLDARRGRQLTREEFEEFPRIVAAIELTLTRLAALDTALIAASAEAFSAADLGLSGDE
jgi:hypothetical protein